VLESGSEERIEKDLSDAELIDVARRSPRGDRDRDLILEQGTTHSEAKTTNVISRVVRRDESLGGGCQRAVADLTKQVFLVLEVPVERRRVHPEVIAECTKAEGVRVA
jgi:hypothetical protein